MTIREFQGEYRWLSNFWPCKVKGPGGLIYPSVEHAYQAYKGNEIDWPILAQPLLSAGAAKRYARKNNLVMPGGDPGRLNVMISLLIQKYDPNVHPDLVDKLIATGEEELWEGNRWCDRFFGCDPVTGEGLNYLGKMTMAVRASVAQDRKLGGR